MILMIVMRAMMKAKRRYHLCNLCGKRFLCRLTASSCKIRLGKLYMCAKCQEKNNNSPSIGYYDIGIEEQDNYRDIHKARPEDFKRS